MIHNHPYESYVLFCINQASVMSIHESAIREFQRRQSVIPSSESACK